MLLVRPSFEIVYITDHPLQRIEAAGRTCYKSENKITHGSAKKFVEKINIRRHFSVIEHSSMSVRVICDRGVTHEIVRHRLCAFSQESTRYCNYKGGVAFIIPPWISMLVGEYGYGEYFGKLKREETTNHWFAAMLAAEKSYLNLLQMGWSPQEARSVLPNSLKTEIVWTANLREWRHIFTLRTSSKSHPQMQEIMRPLLDEVKTRIPVIFDDITYGEGR